MTQDLRNVVHSYDRAREEAHTSEFAASRELPYVNLVNFPFVGEVIAIIPRDVAERFRIVSFMKIGHNVRVASPNPFAQGLAEAMGELGAKLSLTFQPFICSKSSAEYSLTRYDELVAAVTGPAKAQTKEQFAVRISTLKDLKDAIDKVSTTELLETILSGGLSLDATDVHFEPGETAVAIRFRIDGKLVEVIDLPEKTYHLLASRIKTLSHIKLDVKKVAQDGRFTFTVGEQHIDIRVNAVPTAYGETIELRLLTFKNFLSLDQLNVSPDTQKAILDAVSRPEGLVLFTGPTGSGKTTSLYAVLQLLNKPDSKIVTIEDPVEYRIEGIEQVQVNPPDGFDFPQALRAVLRQDPNVIMVGEIRDVETAQIAIDAALTGHLVLSTLHTNSAAASFARLLQIGVPKYLLADAISLVVAQRLVRRVCAACGGTGCDVCYQTGFRGRFLIVEHFVPDAQTIELIKREASLSEFEEMFKKLGNRTLLDDGLEKAAQGLTTEEEVRSVA